jgi:hypothetical protein
MKIKTGAALSMAFIGACAIAVQASAGSLVSDTVDFTATGFTALPGSGPAPTDPVTGSFTITFNSTQTYTDATAGITLNNLNIALGSQIGFNYSPTGQYAGQLWVGGIQDGVCCVQISPTLYDDFYLHITNIATNPAFQQLGYTTPSGYWYTTGTDGSSISVTPVNSAPEIDPASAAGGLTLLLGALMVLSGRRSRAGAAA